MFLASKAPAKPVLPFPLTQFVGSALGEAELLVPRAILPRSSDSVAWSSYKTPSLSSKAKPRIIIYSDIKAGSSLSPPNALKLQMKIIQIYLKLVHTEQLLGYILPFADFEEVTFHCLVYGTLNPAWTQQESLDADLNLEVWNR